MAPVIAPELLDDEIAALIKAGGYDNDRDVVRHAISALLDAKPDLRRVTAVELYRTGKIAFAEAVELSGLAPDAFRKILCVRPVSPDADLRASLEEMAADPDIIRELEEIERDLAGTEVDGLELR